MPGREGSRCLTRQEQVASYSRALVVTAATATTLRAAVLLRRMSLSRSRVFPGVCTKAHEGVFQGAPRGGAHTSWSGLAMCLWCVSGHIELIIKSVCSESSVWSNSDCLYSNIGLLNCFEFKITILTLIQLAFGHVNSDTIKGQFKQVIAASHPSRQGSSVRH